MLEAEFSKIWQELALPAPHTLLLSGGGDSVALFYLLKAVGVEFAALHFVHDGSEKFSEASRRFCEDLCARNEVALELKQIAGKEFMAQGDLSWEAACRSLRYKELQSRRGKFLTAHTADDQAETLVLRLLGGSGLAGLGGIKPQRQDGVARPLLKFSRIELREYLKLKGASWLEDPTNVDGNDRARLRQRVMPLLTEVQSNLLETLGRTAGYLRQDEVFLQSSLDQWLQQHNNDHGDSWNLEAVRSLPGALSIRFFKRLWLAFSPAGFRPRGTLFEEARKLVVNGRNDSWVSFPGGWAIGILGEKLWARPVLVDEPWSLATLESTATDGEEWQVGEGRTVRSRRAGDKFRGRCLKKVLASTGHPPWVRERWPLLAGKSDIIAVYGIGEERGFNAEPTHRVSFEPLALRGTISATRTMPR